MSLQGFKTALNGISSWAGPITAGPDLYDFPLREIERALTEDTFEAGWAALDKVATWSRGDGARKVGEVVGSRFPQETLYSARMSLEICLSIYEKAEDGGLTMLPDGARDTGRERYHSLANAVLYHGFEASVFNRAVKAEPVYDGREALNSGAIRLHELTPTGVVSQYRITVLDGALMHPPLHASEAQARASETIPPDMSTEAPGM